MSSGILKTGVSQVAQDWWCQSRLIRVELNGQICRIESVVSMTEMDDWLVDDKGEVAVAAEIAIAMAERLSIANHLLSAVI